MTDDGEQSGGLPSPDDAFVLLGDETRVAILRALGEADGPLSFSALRERVGLPDSGQFNYHLEKLVGHFVERSGDGYALRRPGRRVVEAVLSGAVTDDPTLERTRVDETCELCGAPVEAVWESGSVRLYCTECDGRYGRGGAEAHEEAHEEASDRGYLGRLPLPPAGVEDRTPTEVVRAAWTWGHLEILAMASGICPRCAAPVERAVDVCEAHDAEGGPCDACGNRYAVGVTVACTNCIFEAGGSGALALAASTDTLDFLTDHGVNPVAPSSLERVNAVYGDYEETVRTTDPLSARLAFAVDGDELAFDVGEDLRVFDAER